WRSVLLRHCERCSMLGPPVLGILVYGPFVEAHLILWLCFLTFSAHTFLVVVQETSAGADKVTWPGDPWTERLGSFLYLGGLLALWLAPVFYLTYLEIVDLEAWEIAAVIWGIVWLIFPVSLLSSLSATSRWVILRPVVLWRLLRHLPSLLVFYALSALVLGLTLGLFGLAVFLGKLPLLDDLTAGNAGWLLETALLLGPIFLFP